MSLTLLVTAAAFIVIFVAVGEYSEVSSVVLRSIFNSLSCPEL